MRIDLLTLFPAQCRAALEGGAHAGAMAGLPRKTSFAGPTAVPVHDDRHVFRRHA